MTMRINPLLFWFSCIVAGLAQETPAQVPVHDGSLRLQPATENNLPQRPPRKPTAATLPTTKPKPELAAAEGKLNLSSAAPLGPVEIQVPERSVTPFRQDKAGLLFGGYDPVARFGEQNLKKGRAEIFTEFASGRILFTDEANRSKFLQEPAAYLPEFGDYCAYHLSNGEARMGNPTAYRILSGRLYVFTSEAFARSWEKAPELHLPRAREAWAKLAER